MMELAVIDPDELSQNGLENMVRTLPSWNLAGIYSTVSDFEQSINQVRIQGVLLNDSGLKHGELWKLLDYWQEILPSIHIVILSRKLSHRYLQKLFAHDVLAFIYRPDCTLSTLAACLESIAQKRHYISPQASAELYMRHDQADALGLRAIDLDILHCLNNGMNTQQIALSLNVTERTIHRSRNRLRAALNVTINERLIPAAIHYGLITEVTE